MKALVAIALAAFAACLTQHDLDVPPPGRKAFEPKLVVRRENDAETGALLREWTVLHVPRERDVKHGRESSWYPNGAKEWERDFDHGEPRGTWRRWYSNGVPAVETIFAGADVETAMRFWHENGNVAAEGLARNGVRGGAWRHWREDGSLEAEGSYVDSRREGPWTLHGADGRVEICIYARGVRISRGP